MARPRPMNNTLDTYERDKGPEFMRAEAERELASATENMPLEERKNEQGLQRWAFEQKRNQESSTAQREHDQAIREDSRTRLALSKQEYDERKARAMKSNEYRRSAEERKAILAYTASLGDAGGEVISKQMLKPVGWQVAEIERDADGNVTTALADGKRFTLSARAIKEARMKLFPDSEKLDEDRTVAKAKERADLRGKEIGESKIVMDEIDRELEELAVAVDKHDGRMGLGKDKTKLAEAKARIDELKARRKELRGTIIGGTTPASKAGDPARPVVSSTPAAAPAGGRPDMAKVSADWDELMQKLLANKDLPREAKREHQRAFLRKHGLRATATEDGQVRFVPVQ